MIVVDLFGLLGFVIFSIFFISLSIGNLKRRWSHIAARVADTLDGIPPSNGNQKPVIVGPIYFHGTPNSYGFVVSRVICPGAWRKTITAIGIDDAVALRAAIIKGLKKRRIAFTEE